MRRARWFFCADPSHRSGFVAALALLLTALPAVAVDLGDGLVHLKHASLPAAVPEAPTELPGSPTGPGVWIVTFRGPADASLRRSVEDAGGRIVGYAPSNAYFVRGDVATAHALDAVPDVIGVRDYPGDWRVDPVLNQSIDDRGAASPWLFVDVWPGEVTTDVAALVREEGLEVVRVSDRPGLHRLLVRADPEHAATLAELPAVEWVSAPPRPVLRNDVVRWVIQSDVTDQLPLWDAGLLGAGEILGHIDAPLQLESCYFVDPDRAEAGPDHRKVVAYRKNPTDPLDVHGTHTAGTAVGDRWDDPAATHRGMAPRARIMQTSYFLLDGFMNAPSNLRDLLEDAHTDGARVHSNSYGDDSQTSYTTWCVDVDAFTRENEDDLVIFAVTNGALLRTPENAKNGLAVGACRKPGSEGLIQSGGSGPTSDDRRKPEVFAPGQNTVSAGLGVCTVATRSGTSMAAPAVAGGALLVREYFRRGFAASGRAHPEASVMPTGALLKAMIVNSAVDMTGAAGYPTPAEGWGRILLENSLYFEGDARRLWYRDVRHAQGLATGEERSWYVPVVSSGEPLSVTMVFTDQPASLGASVAPVNDLDLVVEGPDGTFLGNSFDVALGRSTAGGAADDRNNVERVVLPAPTAGAWTVRVLGTSVPMGPQGFALVVNGALATRIPRPAEVRAGVDSPSGAGSLSMAPAAPNPFSSATDVEYRLERRGFVALRVYDLRGRLVRTLVNRELDGGSYRAIWDGRDDQGRSTVGGMYFLRLTASGEEKVARVVRIP